MDAINKIIIDVSDPLNTQVVHTVQEDIRSRFVEITLVRNGEPLDIPVGAVGVVGLRRPNETYVLYDTDEDGNAAVSFDGNIATCYLRQEALAMAGSMYTSVSIYSADHTTRLTAFHFMTDVDATAVPSDVIVDHDYINIFQAELDEINTLLGDLSATATTLPAGSDATASYSNGVFSFGIPKGDTGGVTEEELDEALETKAPVIVDSASGNIAHASDGAGGMHIRSLIINIVPVQSGSGDPSPTNIRTISGRTGLTVTRLGKNLFDVSSLSWNAGIRNDDGSAGSSSASHYTNAIPIPENTSITISGTLRTSSSTYRVYFLKADGTWISRTGSAQASPKVLDPPSGCGMIQLQVSNSVNMQDVQVEAGFYATPYEEYQSTQYPVSWQSEAGTVYGGTLDVVSGLLTVDRGILTLGSSIPSGTSGIQNIATVGESVRFEYYPYRAIGAASTPLISDKFANAATNAGNPWVCDTGSSSSPRMYVCMGSTYTTDALIRQWFASNPTDFVYYLATPQTYQLTPTEVSMLLGANNIFSDGGSVLLTYPCDTKLYIQKLTQP